jgi:hypothetical protein
MRISSRERLVTGPVVIISRTLDSSTSTVFFWAALKSSIMGVASAWKQLSHTPERRPAGSCVMSDETKDEPESESKRHARIHQEVAERLRNDRNCIYDDADDGEGLVIVGGIDHGWAAKDLRRAKK